MSVIPLTIFFSLLLAGTFVVLFAREQRRRHLTSPERDSLLPLADETPLIVPARPTAPVTPAPAAHASGGCGCRRGVRPPCRGCLQRLDAQEPAYF
ncbi:hypothetical protein Verru16b_00345 [Lacunisphaera limnophila]|uniref:Uncharacterized protein n=1 Tax=Lacunisphaera limnophila TaxID=1838286 RepID=A0A1I7PI46_9BACT|nr:hypothetical protein [Lacunisphaera limnophila]AOS43302.1 hypothetical protein Verru16b_00345 [Lacunisphaera limnophila]